MASFLEVQHKGTLKRRYYVGGCRVTAGQFNSLGTGPKSCFHTVETKTSWKHYYEQAL